MANNLESRLATLEQTHRRARPMLVIALRPEQEGKPTPEQAAQITKGEKQGREVKLINYRIV